MLRKWEDIPDFMKTPEVRPYWECLNKKKAQIIVKRSFDLLLSIVLLILLIVPMAIIAVWIKTDSQGPIFFRQERATAYGKNFRIHKFRTMVNNADKMGSEITVEQDKRITKVGKKIRRLRLDELPQLFDVISGNMSFVGTRPEAINFVQQYKPEYYATLLLPAGITSETSIRYKDEAVLLSNSDNVDYVYLNKVLPEKMIWNLKSIENFSIISDINTIIRTMCFVIGKGNI